MSLQRIAEGLDEMDADAWYGVVLLSIKKLNPRFDDATLDAMNMIDLLGAMNDAAEEELDAASPPPVATVSVAASPNGSPSSSASEETPVTPGTPISLASSE